MHSRTPSCAYISEKLSTLYPIQKLHEGSMAFGLLPRAGEDDVLVEVSIHKRLVISFVEERCILGVIERHLCRAPGGREFALYASRPALS